MEEEVVEDQEKDHLQYQADQVYQIKVIQEEQEQVNLLTVELEQEVEEQVQQDQMLQDQLLEDQEDQVQQTQFQDHQ